MEYESYTTTHGFDHILSESSQSPEKNKPVQIELPFKYCGYKALHF